MTNSDERDPIGDVSSDAASLKRAAKDEAAGAERALNETGADLSKKAGDIAGDAKEAVARKAEDVKHGLSGGLKAFGGALRAAGDHLAESGQGGPSRLVGEAASGVERLAESMDSKPLNEVFEELRDLGRNNGGGLFAGSMLAGLALGRLLRAQDDVSSTGMSRSEGHAKGSTDVQSSADAQPSPTATDPGYAP